MTQLNGLHGQRSAVGARPRGRFAHKSQVFCRNWRVLLQSVAVEPMTEAEDICPALALAKLSCQTAGARKETTFTLWDRNDDLGVVVKQCESDLQATDIRVL